MMKAKYRRHGSFCADSRFNGGGLSIFCRTNSKENSRRYDDRGATFHRDSLCRINAYEEWSKVIEFNTRFGDPETQVVLPLLKNDLVQVMQDVLEKKNPNLEWHAEACVGVVLASEGYPGSYSKGNPLPYFDDKEYTYIIHAGTKK